MAKKYRSSHRVHGLHSVKSQAVRWLGAFGYGSSVEKIAEFEMNPRREVSCEIIPIGKVSHIKAMVGSSSNQELTMLVAGYAGDAWTKDSRNRDVLGEALPDRDRAFSTNGKPSVDCINRPAIFVMAGVISKASIAGPRYTAIVVKRGAGESAFAFADSLAKATNLPVVEVVL